jgi:hypothetical protein
VPEDEPERSPARPPEPDEHDVEGQDAEPGYFPTSPFPTSPYTTEELELSHPWKILAGMVVASVVGLSFEIHSLGRSFDERVRLAQRWGERARAEEKRSRSTFSL